MYWKTICALATGLASLSSALPAVVDKDVTDEFVGQGQIHVLNSSSLSTAAPTDRIGCLNEHGMLTMSECAVFTRLDGGFGTSVKLSTSSGNCTFMNPNMPTNKDSYYGSDSHAWSCWDVPSPEYDSVWEHYYTIKGFKYPFVCNGNINCFYDTVAPPGPSPEEKGHPVWQFFWGAHQMDVPPGHLQVIWLWVPVGSS